MPNLRSVSGPPLLDGHAAREGHSEELLLRQREAGSLHLDARNISTSLNDTFVWQLGFAAIFRIEIGE